MTPQQLYNDEVRDCPRSPEWKAGALRGLRKASGDRCDGSPYYSGTAQDDAWLAGNQYGMAVWKHAARRVQA